MIIAVVDATPRLARTFPHLPLHRSSLSRSSSFKSSTNHVFGLNRSSRPHMSLPCIRNFESFHTLGSTQAIRASHDRLLLASSCLEYDLGMDESRRMRVECRCRSCGDPWMVKSSFPSGHKSWLNVCSIRDLLQGCQSMNDSPHLRLVAFLFFPTGDS